MRLVFLLFILGALCVVEPSAAQESDESLIRHFKTVLWPQAYRTQDVELLDRWRMAGHCLTCIRLRTKTLAGRLIRILRPKMLQTHSRLQTLIAIR